MRRFPKIGVTPVLIYLIFGCSQNNPGILQCPVGNLHRMITGTGCLTQATSTRGLRFLILVPTAAGTPRADSKNGPVVAGSSLTLW